MSQWHNGVVLENIRWNERLYSIRIATEAITFTAGQYTRLRLEVDGTLVARPYSFVNAPDDPVLEFFFNTVPAGPLSNRLARLRCGDKIEISQPSTGFMVLNEVPQGQNLWLLATSTAIGPFLSMLATDQPWPRFEQVVLAYSVRSPSDLCYRQRLDRVASERPGQFRWQPFVSGEVIAETIHGRIPAAIADGRLEQQLGLALTAADSQVLVCGNPDMVKDALDTLQLRGLSKNLRRSPGQITVERYW